MLRHRAVNLRFPQAAWFSLAVYGLGAGGGAGGHYLFVHVLRGSLERRAAKVGFLVGLATSTGAWTMTYLARDAIGPFERGPDADRILLNSLPVAAISGPLAGMLVSRLVVRRLRARFAG